MLENKNARDSIMHNAASRQAYSLFFRLFTCGQLYFGCNTIRQQYMASRWMAYSLQVRNGKTVWWEPHKDRSLHLLQVLMWKRCKNFPRHTATDWRNHFYTQWQVNSVFCWGFFPGDAQIFTVCLILWFVDEAWISSVSMGSFKTGAKNNSNIWQQHYFRSKVLSTDSWW